jgi:predicted phosphoribosyltransferase
MTGINEAEFDAVCQEELAEIERRRQLYLGERRRVEIAGRAAIVVDDGVATGATTRAALRAARMHQPRTLILAVPVGPTDMVAALGEEADRVICLEQPRSFAAIGLCYEDFRQVSDDEVINALARFPEREGKTLRGCQQVKAWRHSW